MLACRRELVAYDRNQQDQSVGGSASSISMLSLSEPPPIGRCYGCASAATEHCLTLLRALAASAASRQTLCAQGLIAELLDNNLRRGTVQVSLFYIVCSVLRFDKLKFGFEFFTVVTLKSSNHLQYNDM